MSSLSNERLKEIVEYHPGCENYATRIEWMAMARELLAYREAQGKAEYFINRIDTVDAWGSYAELRAYEDELDAEKSKADHGGFVFRLYAAPQLPAIPDEITPDDERIMAIEGVTPPLDTGNSPVIPDGWISVGDRLPDHDELVLVWPTNDFGVESHTGQYLKHHKKGAGWFAQIDEQNYGIEFYPINVTHWMPLPAAPKPE